MQCSIYRLWVLAIPALAFPPSPPAWGKAGVSDDAFADVMVSYDAGVGAAPGYVSPASTLGPPERITGETVCQFCVGVASPFNTPFGFDEIVSIGTGGHLTLQFNTPVTDDPNNMYGVDLLIFGNTGLIDLDYPNAIVDGVYSNDGGIVQVSVNGQDWITVPNRTADALMPTLGFLDSGPYDVSAGLIETSFTQPADPQIQLQHLLGLQHDQVVELYRGSGGGTQIDLATVGLSEISFVRILNPAGGGGGGGRQNVEIDAVSDVAPRQMGDVNLDGFVNVDDLLLLISAWGNTTPGGVPADFDLNAHIDVDDLLIIIANWSE